MTLDEADILVKQTDYAFALVEDDNPVNWADAAMFFMEGYGYAMKEQLMESDK